MVEQSRLDADRRLQFLERAHNENKERDKKLKNLMVDVTRLRNKVGTSFNNRGSFRSPRKNSYSQRPSPRPRARTASPHDILRVPKGQINNRRERFRKVVNQDGDKSRPRHARASSLIDRYLVV